MLRRFIPASSTFFFIYSVLQVSFVSIKCDIEYKQKNNSFTTAVRLITVLYCVTHLLAIWPTAVLCCM